MVQNVNKRTLPGDSELIRRKYKIGKQENKENIKKVKISAREAYKIYHNNVELTQRTEYVSCQSKN